MMRKDYHKSEEIETSSQRKCFYSQKTLRGGFKNVFIRRKRFGGALKTFLFAEITSGRL